MSEKLKPCPPETGWRDSIKPGDRVAGKMNDGSAATFLVAEVWVNGFYGRVCDRPGVISKDGFIPWEALEQARQALGGGHD